MTMNYLPRLIICLNNTLIIMTALHHFLSRLSNQHRYSTDNHLVLSQSLHIIFISNRTCSIIMVYQPGCEGKPILNQVV